MIQAKDKGCVFSDDAKWLICQTSLKNGWTVGDDREQLEELVKSVIVEDVIRRLRIPRKRTRRGRVVELADMGVLRTRDT